MVFLDRAIQTCVVLLLLATGAAAQTSVPQQEPQQAAPSTAEMPAPVSPVVRLYHQLRSATLDPALVFRVRELAIDLAPLVRVNGLAPATVVEGSNMFPRDRVIS